MTSVEPGDTGSPYVPKGYVVFDLEIHGRAGYEAYRLDGQASVRRFGGRVLSGEPAPQGVVESLEGGWATKRFVINEFPTVDTAGHGTSPTSTKLRHVLGGRPALAGRCWSGDGRGPGNRS